jgi:DNA-binding MarR family transcriptional regulator
MSNPKRNPKRTGEQAPRLGALLRIASQSMTQRLAEWLAESEFADLQPSHSAAIQPLWEDPQGARITTLARRSRVSKQAMSVLVDHLVERGYAERVPDPDDARAVRVRLSARGRALGAAVRATSRHVEADWAVLVGAERVQGLIDTLELLRGKLQGRHNAAP